MVDFIHLGIFGIIFLIILAIVNNTSQSSIENIQDQIFLMNCPLPLFEGIPTNVTISGFAVVYDIQHNVDINGNTTTNDQEKVGTEFDCSANDGLFGVSTTIRQYGATLFSVIPYGWFGFLLDLFSHEFQNVYALFTLISYFISPLNFNILGITIVDLSGIALLFVISIYAFCYIMIGLMIFTVVSNVISGVL